MASLVLGVAGSALGAGFGGTILGLSGAAIGGLIGSSVGSVIDSWIVAGLAPGQRVEGARLDSLRFTASSEGAVLPRLYGRMRLGGNVIWATDFSEDVRTTRQGGKGGRPRVTTTEYSYAASFAIALCEGPITGIGRIWADGDPVDLSLDTWRWYPGDESQAPDPFILAKMGPNNAPAYRGVAYVVFEELSLERFGNRIPQLSFEVFRPLAEPDTAEGLVRAVTMIPASGEFTYATTLVTRTAGDATIPENENAIAERADIEVSLDRLEASAPGIESVSLVVAWFGNDLRCGVCSLRPGVEFSDKVTEPLIWSVNGIERADAYLVSRDALGRPIYGGTPADAAVVEAIRAIKARGLRVTLYPFILMDVPPGNTRPDPYSPNAAGVGQPAFPWRGRITCSPAAGFAGSPDKTAAAGAQVAAFFGSAAIGDFGVSGTEVVWNGAPGDFGLRRMILHYAHLCAAAGGVDAFLIGTEMRGLTWVRSGPSTYPAVAAFAALAADVRTIVGAGTKIGYASDWSEYFGHHPADGSNDVFFHLDPLWASPNIDIVAIDNYMPLSDWRDGFAHADALAWPAIYDRGYLQSNVAGGEGFDWFYASPAARNAQIRTPITDGAGKPWVFRFKDVRSWWSNQHFNRPGGVESGTPTAWVPQSKPIWFTELGCPAIDRGANQPNVFVDPKSSESFLPFFSRGWRDDAMQRAFIEAAWGFWGNPANNPISAVYGGRMIDMGECAAWTWDARPYPFFPAAADVWADGENWRLGHWLGGRLGAVSLAALVRDLCRRAGLPPSRIDVSGLWGAVEGYAIAALEAPRSSVSVLARHFGFDAVESQGLIRFVMRGRAPDGVVSPDGMVAEDAAEPFELVRAQETEIPQALRWTIARADEDYDSAVVEAQRITVTSARVAAESFPMAVPPEEADRRCRRALQEGWAGRESATFRLPPSRLALDAADVIRFDHAGRSRDLRIVSTAEAEARNVEAVAQDREVYDPPATGRPRARVSRPAVYGRPVATFLDLPQLRADVPAHQAFLAVEANPWPGAVAVYRSPGLSGFAQFTAFRDRPQIGRLAEPLPAGPTDLFDLGSVLTIDLGTGTLTGVDDLALFAGANAFAIRTGAARWEIVQAANVELVAPGRYRCTRLLRGVRGTEWAMGDPAAAGSFVVVLDDKLAVLPVSEADVGVPWNWRIGPASKPVTDRTFAAESWAPLGAGLRPFSPARIEQPALPRTPGDCTIRWTRRSRALSADNWGSAEPPLVDGPEAYEVEILDGASVVRTLATATTSAVYTAAAQTADFGAPLAAGDFLDLRVFQISETFGRGAPRAARLIF